MRILHTADWHLGKRLGPFSRLEEQRDFLQELVELCRSHRVDMVVVAGDVFDVPNPSSEAVELLYRSLKILAEDGNRPVVVIGGNHDSAERIDAPDPLARENGIFFYGSPLAQPGDCNLACGLRVRHPEPGFARFSHPAWDREVALIVAPFANEHRLKLSLPVEEGTSPFAQEDRNTREMPQPDGTPAAPENQSQHALESGSTPNTGSQPRLDAGSENRPQPDGTPAAPENRPQHALEFGSTPNTGSQPRLDAGSENRPQPDGTPAAPENRPRGTTNLQGLLARRWQEIAERQFQEQRPEIRLFVGHFFFAAPGTARAGLTEVLRGEEGEGERSVLHPGGIELISTAAIPQVDYAAFGHLHRPQILHGEQRFPAVYAGSPIAYSQAEANQEKTVTILESQDLGIMALHTLAISSGRRILRHRASSPDEALSWLKEHPDDFIDLEIETPRFLEGGVYQEIKQSHPRLLSIVPVLTAPRDNDRLPESMDPREQGLEDLFARFFQERKGVAPSEEILTLFRELASLDPDEVQEEQQ